MARDIERRLRTLEAHASVGGNDQGWLTLDQWVTYHETGELPQTEGARLFLQHAQVRDQEAEETMAMFAANSTAQL